MYIAPSVNSQPSAANGMKCIIRIMPQLLPHSIMCGDVFEIFIVTKNSAGGLLMNLSGCASISGIALSVLTTSLREACARAVPNGMSPQY